MMILHTLLGTDTFLLIGPVFCDFKPHAKFQNPRTNPSGRKVSDPEEGEKKNNPKNSGHYVPAAKPKGSARISLDQNHCYKE